MNKSLPIVEGPISCVDRSNVKALLGRTPRGLAAINVRTKTNLPVVIQVESMVNKKPFPTLFWLVDKKLNYAIDKLEAGGLIVRPLLNSIRNPLRMTGYSRIRSYRTLLIRIKRKSDTISYVFEVGINDDTICME